MSDSDPPVLKAILVADLAQYSVMTAAAEEVAVDFVTRCLDVFREHCADWRGEFIKSTGDGALILFDSATDALSYALGVQERLAEIASVRGVASLFRIGVHLGELRRRGNDVYGHAINLAARVESVALPGGVCTTQEVYHSVRSSARFAFRFAGHHALKNMPQTVSLYQVSRLDDAEPHAQRGQLAVALVDGFTAFDPSGEPIDVRSRVAQALIGYLSLAPEMRDLKDRIATLLWPERPPAQARAALGSCVRSVRRVGFGGLLLQRGGYLGLDQAQVALDVQRLLGNLEAGKIDDILVQRPDWPEAILYGLDSVSSLYTAWVRVTRHNVRSRAVEVLEHLLGRFDSVDPLVRRVASALLALEPSHEQATRCLMLHHAGTQNTAAALRAYERLRRTLNEQHGLEPDPQTSELAASLSQPLRLQKSPRAPQDRPPVILIEPFGVSSEDVAVEAAGFRAELISNLSNFRGLTVVDLQGRADLTDVDYVLTGECRPVGSNAQLFIMLREPSHGRVVWSDVCRLSLDEWGSLQRQLVGRIASNVDIYLSHDRLARALRKMPEDLGVYDTWLRGEHLLLHWSAQSEDEAERLFEKAIAQDPNFAPAYASLASVYTSRQFVRPGLQRRREDEDRALRVARKSADLDPLDARNLMVVAWSAAMARQFEQAELTFQLASDLNPNHPKVLVSAAMGLSFMGRNDIARGLLAHSMALTAVLPAFQWSHIAIVRFLAGDFVGTVEAADRSQNLIIDTAGWKAAALALLGDQVRSEVAFGELLQAARAAWAGSFEPSNKNIVDWFVGAFPFREEKDRQRLAASLPSA